MGLGLKSQPSQISDLRLALELQYQAQPERANANPAAHRGSK